MKLENYYSINNGFIQFTREQASHFAKDIAGDYNPIHDPEAKRFCVPGDLLFACTLLQFGLSHKMQFIFSGMVDSGIALDFTPHQNEKITICNADGKEYLSATQNGDTTQNAQQISSFIEQYVKFSGLSFPDLLVPLMAEKNAMINPQRPLVMYNSMSIEIDSLEMDNVSLEFDHSNLEINGKRGEAFLNFKVLNNQQQIGKGCKSMLLSGLREYDSEVMDNLVEEYTQKRAR